jgi:hypothetical protein
MKKIAILVCFAALFAGCKSQSPVATKTDWRTAKYINGHFTITKVTNPGNDYIAVTSFQLADSHCFEGSSWNFVSNNNKGDMALAAGGDCPNFSSPIRWYLNSESQFVLKVLDAGEKAKKVRDGYVLTLSNANDAGFDLSESVNVAGKISNITYHYQKN